MQSIDNEGREKAIAVGANVIMPNVTPFGNRYNYRLYQNKPGMDEGAEESNIRLEKSLERYGFKLLYDVWGDSKYYINKKDREGNVFNR